MFPYHDENETQRTAVVTLAIIGACVVAWLVVQGAGSFVPLASSVCNYGLIPGQLTELLPAGTQVPLGAGAESAGLACVTDQGRQLSTLFTHMFLHGGWMHLIGNMWFLWLFGNNIEDSMTRPRFVIFYFACGLAAALLQTALDPRSGLPMVGASGAISGVMGAYLVLYPRVRVFTIIPLGFYITNIAVPAWVMLVYWAVLQFFGGLGSLGAEGGGVAFWAHVGGFVAGVVLIKIFARTDRMQTRTARQWQPRQVGWR